MVTGGLLPVAAFCVQWLDAGKVEVIMKLSSAMEAALLAVSGDFPETSGRVAEWVSALNAQMNIDGQATPEVKRLAEGAAFHARMLAFTARSIDAQIQRILASASELHQ